MNADQGHNQAMLPIMRLIVEHAATEADQWVIIESLCCGIGNLHGRNAKATATFVETIADRICEGERDDAFRKATQ